MRQFQIIEALGRLGLDDYVDENFDNIRKSNLNLPMSCFSNQIVKWVAKLPVSDKNDSVSRLSDEQLLEFAKGGVVLMNGNAARGFDYATVDNGVLTLFEVKYSKPTIDESGNVKHGLLKQESIEKKIKLCDQIFEGAAKRCPLIKSRKLVVLSYRNVDKDSEKFIKLKEDDGELVVFRPADCARILPPSFSERFEMVLGSTGDELIAQGSKILREMAIKMID